MNPFIVHRHVFHSQISPISSISSILLYKFPDPVPEQMLLRLIRLPPHTRFLPRVHLADPYVRRTVETAAVEGALPQRRPEPLPPCHVLSRAEHMLVEKERASGFEHVLYERSEGALGFGDRTECENRDEGVDGAGAAKRGEDEGDVFRPIRHDQERPCLLGEALARCEGAYLGVHKFVRLERNVLGDFGWVEVEHRVTMAYKANICMSIKY